MIARNDISVFILAGGKSSRMGQDKAELIWNGKIFIEHIIDAMQSCGLQLHIVSSNLNIEKLAHDARIAVFKDRVYDKGPLGGIYTALYHSASPYNFIVSCDMPCITADAINYFIDNTNESVINIANANNRLQPLFAMYHKSLLSEIEAAIQINELAIYRLIEKHAYHCIDMNEFSQELRNINTIEDYQLLIQNL
ncbi:MAG: molybdenum cofactor guanylyltransferase [Bacteroidetes bacterium]|nr:molybdenum cofactor guanylyltransferase [Bacteroidota bacterium]